MNPGTAPGFGPGVVAGTISRYIQTPLILTSQTIAVPPGTQRIEALLVGGGGGSGVDINGAGTYGGGGGFGGACIIEIPITGSPLQVVIGAGGAPTVSGSPTYVVSAGTRYAEVGGGGAGYASWDGASTYYSAYAGRSGGGGGGSSGISASGYVFSGAGGMPPIGKLLWCALPQSQVRNNYVRTVVNGATDSYVQMFSGGGIGAKAIDGTTSGTNGPLGAGAGGGYSTNGGGAQYGGSSLYGGGGATGGTSGGSLTGVTIWGYTGYGTTGRGGGGMFGAGGTVDGGLGGGGGGMAASPYGTGGNGAAVIRFYL